MSRPGFVVLHGNRLEDLRELLVEHVRAHPPPPLGEDLILVQSNGMRHWLELGLADDRGGLGICAGVRMELPAAFLWQAARAVLGEAAVPRRLPLDEEPLVWRLMRLLPHLPPDADFDLLRRYLQGDTDGPTPTGCAAIVWPCNWPTCSTATRATAPIGWPTGRAAARQRSRKTAGRPGCGARCCACPPEPLQRPISMPFGPWMTGNRLRPAIKMRVPTASPRARGPTSTPS